MYHPLFFPRYINAHTFAHSMQGTSGPGDRGQHGIEMFKSAHACNDICAGLGLSHLDVEKDSNNPDDPDES